MWHSYPSDHPVTTLAPPLTPASVRGAHPNIRTQLCTESVTIPFHEEDGKLVGEFWYMLLDDVTYSTRIAQIIARSVQDDVRGFDVTATHERNIHKQRGLLLELREK